MTPPSSVLRVVPELLAPRLPVAFMNSIVGRFLKSFGLTMAFSIVVSLVVSFTLSQMAQRALATLESETEPDGVLVTFPLTAVVKLVFLVSSSRLAIRLGS